MPTDVFAGRSAQIQVSATTSGHADFGRARNFTLAVNRDLIDATSFDSSGWREVITGTANWTLNVETVFLSTASSGKQDDLRVALSSAARQHFKIMNSTAGGSQTWQSWGYVTGWDLGGALSDIQVHNFTVAGDGKLAES